MLSDKSKQYNTWVSLLRVFLCFIVIQDHFSTAYETLAQKFIGFFSLLAVPCFLFLSFFYMAHDFAKGDVRRIRSKILSLYLPVVFWNVIYFLIINTLSLFGISPKIEGSGLIKSMIFSHTEGLAFHLWYLIVQIIIMTIILVLTKLVNSKKAKTAVLFSILIFSLILEYTGIAYRIFENSSFEMQYSWGRTIECMPFAICGILFAWYVDAFDNRKKCIILLVSIVMTYVSMKFIPPTIDFSYGGVYRVMASFTICQFVLLLPDLFTGVVKECINFIGICTAGIYYIHVMVGNILNMLYPNKLFQRTLWFDLFILLVSILIVACSNFLLRKSNNGFIRSII